MAAWGSAAEGAGDRSSSRPRTAALRFLTAALAGGTVLLLWGGAAGARAGDEAAASSPVPEAAGDGSLLSGLFGQGGALTPVIDLVDGATEPLTATTPVGTTVGGVVTTVDPIVTPVVAPATQATAPVTDPVIETVGAVTDAVATGVTPPIGTPTLPGSPTIPPTPTTPVLPPGGPGTLPLPELPGLLPPDTSAAPGAVPGTPSAAGAGAADVSPSAPLPVPLALATTTSGARTEPTTVADRAVGNASRPTSAAPSIDRAERDGATGSPAARVPDAPVAPVPSPCSGGSSTGAGSGPLPAPPWLDGALHAGSTPPASSIDLPVGRTPHPAPSARPEVSPD